MQDTVYENKQALQQLTRTMLKFVSMKEQLAYASNIDKLEIEINLKNLELEQKS